jgi:hypothetical protein
LFPRPSLSAGRSHDRCPPWPSGPCRDDSAFRSRGRR